MQLRSFFDACRLLMPLQELGLASGRGLIFQQPCCRVKLPVGNACDIRHHAFDAKNRGLEG